MCNRIESLFDGFTRLPRFTRHSKEWMKIWEIEPLPSDDNKCDGNCQCDCNKPVLSRNFNVTISSWTDEDGNSHHSVKGDSLEDMNDEELITFKNMIKSHTMSKD